MRRERITDIEIKNLSLKFDIGAPLFNDVNLKFPLGKIIVLEGQPGCGKSIFLRMLAGLVEPTQGDVIYNGRSLREMSFEQFAPLRTSTSICFENGGLLMNKSLIENIKLPLLYNQQWRAERGGIYLDKLISNFNIKDFLDHRPAAVSAGVRKIAGLVRSLVCTPQVLFFDEPNLGIGENAVEALKHCIDEYRSEGKQDELIVMACSDRRFIERFDCERIQIKDSKLIFENQNSIEIGAA
ncbi:MAG: ATP-binding cassette domain-containing protein [Oligoflexia bacterium]|nr:ATP-binding cassette domain-containing protein [Oligoflexia bacterium]